MVQNKERKSSKRNYSRISLRKRKMLVRLVLEQGLSLAHSIKKLKLKLTTARLILQKYKETGTFPMRKFKKMGKMFLDLKEGISNSQEEPSVKIENNSNVNITKPLSSQDIVYYEPYFPSPIFMPYIPYNFMYFS